jgi:hypothetical protein
MLGVRGISGENVPKKKHMELFGKNHGNSIHRCFYPLLLGGLERFFSIQLGMS